MSLGCLSHCAVSRALLLNRRAGLHQRLRRLGLRELNVERLERQLRLAEQQVERVAALADLLGKLVCVVADGLGELAHLIEPLELLLDAVLNVRERPKFAAVVGPILSKCAFASGCLRCAGQALPVRAVSSLGSQPFSPSNLMVPHGATAGLWVPRVHGAPPSAEFCQAKSQEKINTLYLALAPAYAWDLEPIIALHERCRLRSVARMPHPKTLRQPCE